MIETFLAPNSWPFAIALAVTAGLFILEILMSLIGGSFLGMGGEGPDIDVDTDFDLSTDMDIDLDAPDVDADMAEMAAAPSGFLGWLGIQDVPFLIWLVSFLTMFGLSGLIIQSIAMAVLGVSLFTSLAVFAALLPALAVTRIIANQVALIMPKTETTAMRTRFLGGHGQCGNRQWRRCIRRHPGEPGARLCAWHGASDARDAGAWQRTGPEP
ncbi:OB-fold-containig protein [Thalassobius sp. I31.1]|uniref:OB-fold-containig protein n=1 Tax=Thalassobius sp. I31.1 TaxID=2109912 RepID=UPI000D1AA822|nr:OB-fold-containig protein [Thalassobius sp. I31.1]